MLDSYLPLFYKLFSLIVAPIIVALIIKKFNASPRVISYFANVSAVKIPSMDQSQEWMPVYGHTLILQNVGKLSAKNVRLGHSKLSPPYFSIYPDTQYIEVDLPEGGKEIVFPIMRPGEQVIISYLYFPPVTFDKIHTFCKSDEGFAERVPMIHTRLLKPWQKYLLLGFVVVGFSVTIYWSLILLTFLLASHPLVCF